MIRGEEGTTEESEQPGPISRIWAKGHSPPAGISGAWHNGGAGPLRSSLCGCSKPLFAKCVPVQSSHRDLCRMQLPVGLVRILWCATQRKAWHCD